MGSLNNRQREIVGILLFSFAVFALISLYVDGTGWVGNQLKNGLEIAFGELAVLFGFILLICSVLVFRGRHWPINFRKLLGFLLLLSSFVTIYHLFTVYQGYQLPPALSEEISFGKMGYGAGVVGAILMVAFITAFGTFGSYIILVGLSLIGIILVFNISFISIIQKVLNLIRKLIKQGFTGLAEAFSNQLSTISAGRKERALAKDELKKLAQKQKISKAAEITEVQAKPAKRRKKPEKAKQTDGFDEVTQKLKSDPPKPKQNPKVVEVTPEPELVSLLTPEGSKSYRLPSIQMLTKGSIKNKKGNNENKQDLLEQTFASFGIDAKVVNIAQGPVVTRYELQIGPGIKVSRITSLADDIALAMAATDVRIEAPVPGKSVIGIEIPNKETQPVLLRDVLEDPSFVSNPSKVALALGKDIAGNAVVGDLKKWLHLLVAGSTGSGKSVCLNTIITSLLMRATPDEVRMLMIDPKRVELSNYDGIPHLISPVVTDPKKASAALKWAVAEMERRYKMFADCGAKNIDSYYEIMQEQLLEQEANSVQELDQDLENGSDEADEKLEHLPYIVIIVDELADLMMVAAAEVEESICRLAQMARAAGMYLIIATQRPSVDVITGLIKANVPSRISFAVSSQVDSRTILDMGGAERLIGKGDMLYYPLGASKPNRAQGAFVSDKEVDALVNFWKKQGEPDYLEEVVPETVSVDANSPDTDELLDDAIRLVVETGQASISMLQRRFRIGYSRAARIIDMMEVRSIVGPYQGSRPREVLIDSIDIDRSE